MEASDKIATEQKIKEAARKLFNQKGYAATKTREIAAEAGINLALLNYYFRSKEKLFKIIMEETLSQFMGTLTEILSNEETSLDEKIKLFVSGYIDKIKVNPDMPIFILNELNTNPEHLISMFNARERLMKSNFMSQYQEAVVSGKIAAIHPMQFLMTMMGMVVFPFIAAPILKHAGQMDNQNFNNLMDERKELVPYWLDKILKTD